MLLSGLNSWRGWSRRWVFLGSLAAAVTVCAQPAGGVAGTLPEDLLPQLKTILQEALNQSPQTIEAGLEVAQQEARRYIWDAQRLPSVSSWMDLASNQTAVSGDRNSQTRDNGLFYRIDLSQSLFRWGETTNRSALGQLGVLLAEKNYTQAWRQLATTLRQSYLQLIARQAALKFERAMMKLAEAEVVAAKDALKRGAMAPAEAATKEFNVNEQKVRLASAEEDFAAACRTFARLAGLKQLAPESIPDAIPRPKYSPEVAKEVLAGVLRTGGKSAFEAEVNALRAQEADLNYRIAKVRLLPKLDLTGSHAAQNLTTAAPGTVSQTGITISTVALHVTWSIFDGFATRGEKRQYQVARSLYERRAQSAADKALEDAQSLERRLGYDAQFMDFSDVRVQNSTNVEGRARQEFQLGNVGESAIASATAGRYQSEANSTTARANFLGRWSEFVSLAGADPVLNLLPPRYAREKR